MVAARGLGTAPLASVGASGTVRVGAGVPAGSSARAARRRKRRIGSPGLGTSAA